jgi:hypothetical protein
MIAVIAVVAKKLKSVVGYKVVLGLLFYIVIVHGFCKSTDNNKNTVTWHSKLPKPENDSFITFVRFKAIY